MNQQQHETLRQSVNACLRQFAQAESNQGNRSIKRNGTNYLCIPTHLANAMVFWLAECKEILEIEAPAVPHDYMADGADRGL